MNQTLSAHLQCPYCWEQIEIVVDASLPEQQYVEDCFVCCQPILIRVSCDEEGIVYLQGDREND